MGVEERAYLIPRNNAYRPPPSLLATFVERLRREEWVGDATRPWFGQMTFKSNHKHAAATGAYVQRPGDLRDESKYAALPIARSELEHLFATIADEDRRVRWPVEHLRATPLRYPLSVASPMSAEDTYYDVELWLGREYIYVSNAADFGETLCICGAPLEREVDDTLFYAQRLRLACDTCGALHDVSKRTASWRHPETNSPRLVPGGAAFRFALVIDCGKCWPQSSDFAVHPELKTLCETCFAAPFYELLEVY
jgi:hypothetical protein